MDMEPPAVIAGQKASRRMTPPAERRLSVRSQNAQRDANAKQVAAALSDEPPIALE